MNKPEEAEEIKALKALRKEGICCLDQIELCMSGSIDDPEKNERILRLAEIASRGNILAIIQSKQSRT